MTDEKKTTQDEIMKEEISEEKSKPSKFKFECTKCGACCQNRKPIPVTFTDLNRWTKQGSFMAIILPHLELQSLSSEDEFAKIALVPYINMENVDEQGNGKCPFYDTENRICNIYFTMPIFCKTFPLSYNGEKFYISEPTCEGIGKGEMTKEKLTEMRQIAIRDFNERADTTLAMIPLQGLFIQHFMKQSKETIDNLSEEEKKQLDELIKKSHKSEEGETEN